MKKLLVITMASTAAVVAARRFGPALHQRALSKCRQMFERMQEGSGSADHNACSGACAPSGVAAA